jgi:hypothetical protein
VNAAITRTRDTAGNHAGNDPARSMSIPSPENGPKPKSAGNSLSFHTRSFPSFQSLITRTMRWFQLPFSTPNRKQRLHLGLPDISHIAPPATAAEGV